MTNKTVLSVVNLFVVSAFLTTAYGASEYKNITNAEGVTTPALVRSTGGKVKQEWKNTTDSNGNTRRVPINPNMR